MIEIVCHTADHYVEPEEIFILECRVNGEKWRPIDFACHFNSDAATHEKELYTGIENVEYRVVKFNRDHSGQ